MGDNVANLDNLPQDLSISSHFALRVALQTMKERCLSLQQRLTIVEEENYSLRHRIDIDFPSNISEQSELNDLRKQVTDLSQQKSQLTEHIGMVATENRQLWSRLSQLSKERQKINEDKMNTSIFSQQNASGQNLIRSKTFTQHSPNPNLRHKNIDENMEIPLTDLSLEEIELGNDMEAKLNNGNQIVHKTSFGFGYLNDESGSSDPDLIMDSKKCIDGMYDVKRKLLKQQENLKLILSNLELKKYVVAECHDCNKLKKPETADKSLETDDSLIEGLKTSRISPDNNAHQSLNNDDDHTENVQHIDIIHQKKLADETDKICPMCGKIYPNTISFNDYQLHVEHHFIDDSDLDPSQLERNFEYVSHTVGNF